ncbi:hypothetical protein [Gymnodinialimonas sp. 57CJ19]|uniref:hypothetical protein n=1 Tax=Gymnodinialimonas sp. 57CJ19 TaxID=3138498 RepID=UPI003134294D
MFAKNKQRLDHEHDTPKVDWVVVGAACVAVGLVSMMLVAGSVRYHSMEAHADVVSHEFEAEFDAAVTLGVQ